MHGETARSLMCGGKCRAMGCVSQLACGKAGCEGEGIDTEMASQSGAAHLVRAAAGRGGKDLLKMARDIRERPMQEVLYAKRLQSLR